MRTSISVSLGLLPALFLAATAPAQAGSIGLEYTSAGGTIGVAGATITVGWSFTTNQAITIDALDAENVAAGGSVVDLFNSTGTLLASATVLSTDSTEGSPISFFEHAITPVNLASGATYYVDETLAPSLPAAEEVGGMTTNAAISFGIAVSVVGAGMDPTSDFYEGGGYFGPNFDIAPSSSSPEPSSIFLLLAACGCLMLFRRAAMKTL